jgi:peptidoglycan/xylan/chitin deacetylase (PgdA/CDA1 family)
LGYGISVQDRFKLGHCICTEDAMTRKLIRIAARSLGVVPMMRLAHRSGLRILMYHRFGSECGGLERQCQHLRRRYNPVTLMQVADSFHNGKSLPPNAVAVTVDDGYRDYLEHAHAVFAAYGIPTTMFLVSDFIDGRQWLWVDRLQYALATTSRPTLAVSLTGMPTRRFALETREQRRLAGAEVIGLLKEADNDERLRTLDAILRTLEVDLPAMAPREYAPLSWDEVRTLSRQGVEFGAHTRTHPILSRIVDQGVLEEEILASRSRIEAETGCPVLHFCYPNGRRADLGERTVGVLERSGFKTAVTTERGMNNGGVSPFLLRRLGVEPGNPAAYFEELLAGVRSA